MLKNTKFLLILSLFSTCFLLAFRAPKKLQNCSRKHSKMSTELLVERAAVHDQALAQIKVDFKIPERLWKEFMGDCKVKVAQDTLLGRGSLVSDAKDPWILQAIRSALVEYGINSQKVTIKLLKSSDTPAQAVQELANDGTIIHRIELDMYRLNKYSPIIQEALVRHEIMHLLNYDSLEGSYIITMLYKLGYSAQQLEKKPSMIAYRHQRELRADLLAGCDHPQIARALQEFFASYMKITDQDNAKLWTTHPSDKQRHEQLAQLLTTMGESTITA